MIFELFSSRQHFFLLKKGQGQLIAAVFPFPWFTDLLYEGLMAACSADIISLNESLLPDTAMVSLIQAMENIQSL